MTEMEQSWSAQGVPQDFNEKIQALSHEVKRLKSHTIFAKLKRWMYFETAIGLGACYILANSVSQHEHNVLLLLALALAAIFNTYYYVQFLRKADRLIAHDTKSALEGMIALLKGFIRRLKWITLLLTPALSLLMLYSKTTLSGTYSYWNLPFKFMLIQLGITVALTVFAYVLLVKSIIPTTYSKWLKAFEDVYQGLVGE